MISVYDHIARGRPGELEPELVLRVGDLPTSKPLRQWLGGTEALEQIVIDPLGEWREPSRTAEMIVRADPMVTARALTERLARLRPGASAVALDHVLAVAAGSSEIDRLLSQGLETIEEASQAHPAAGFASRSVSLSFAADAAEKPAPLNITGLKVTPIALPDPPLLNVGGCNGKGAIPKVIFEPLIMEAAR